MLREKGSEKVVGIDRRRLIIAAKRQGLDGEGIRGRAVIGRQAVSVVLTLEGLGRHIREENFISVLAQESREQIWQKMATLNRREAIKNLGVGFIAKRAFSFVGI